MEDIYLNTTTMQHKYLTISLCLVLLSCSEGKKQEKQINNPVQVIPVETTDTKKFQQLFTTSNIITLDFCDDCIIGEVHKILFDESGIFVSDKNITKSVKKFDWSGKLIFSINEVGDGLGKYVLPFDIDLFQDYLAVLDVNQRKVLLFDDQTGAFQEERKIGDQQVVTFAHIQEDQFAYHLDGRDLGPEKYALGKISKLSDRNKEMALGVFDFGFTDYMTVEQEFTKNKTGLLFSKGMNDTIYQVDQFGFHPKYLLDFGEKRIHDEIKKEDMMTAMQKIMTVWPHFHWGRVYENSKNIFFLWSGDKGKHHLSVYDKSLEKTFLIEDNNYFPKKLIYADDSKVIMLVTPEEYLENDLNQITKEYRNPVLIVYDIH